MAIRVFRMLLGAVLIGVFMPAAGTAADTIKLGIAGAP